MKFMICDYRLSSCLKSIREIELNFLGLLTMEDGDEKLFWNVGKELSLLAVK